MKSCYNLIINRGLVKISCLVMLVFFITGCKEEPTVTTDPVVNISTTTATSGGKVLEDGRADVTARGVCWNTTRSPTINDSKTMDGAGIGSYTSSIMQLAPNTLYYVKAYAINEKGTGYGKAVSFTTNPLLLATVTTSQVTSITSSSASGGGNVLSDGGAEVTARGVCWNTSPNPSTSNFKTTDGSGLGSFTSLLTGLKPGKTYYLKAYATNSVGTNYGEEVNFSTPAIKPTLTTNAISDITYSSAKSGGNITDDGGANVTTRGVCWSTSPGPTTSNFKTTDGSGLGSFISSLAGLLPGTQYYVRAYASNSVDISYGNQIEFTTRPLTDFNGNTYRTVTIGTQVWMAENLKATSYRDGTPIDYVMNSTWLTKTTGAYCYYNNDYKYRDTYGALYNWYAVSDARSLCPTGWHVPSYGEWSILATFLGGVEVAGGKMKETGYDHWIEPNTGATNSSGFTALPGGYRHTALDIYFIMMGKYATWWTSTEYSTTNAYWRYITHEWGYLYAGNFWQKQVGMSVRCVKD